MRQWVSLFVNNVSQLSIERKIKSINEQFKMLLLIIMFIGEIQMRQHAGIDKSTVFSRTQLQSHWSQTSIMIEHIHIDNSSTELIGLRKLRGSRLSFYSPVSNG